MMFNDTQKVYQRNEAHPWQTLGEDTIVIEPRGQMSHEISGTGSFIWELLDGTRSTEAIIERMCEVFDGPPEMIRQDVLGFVATLEGKGLIQCPQIL